MTPHASTTVNVAAALATDLEAGLGRDEAERRLRADGPNRLPARRPPPYARIAARQLLDPLVLLLLAAAIASVVAGDRTEAIAIAAIVVLNGCLAFWQEAGAERAIRALATEVPAWAFVVRSNAVERVPAETVVRGDVVVLTRGTRIPADGRVVVARRLEVAEAALTGESLPVAKQVAPVDPAAPLAERASMVYAGTGVTDGAGRAVVCSTGADTELARIGALASAATPPPTPLGRRLARLARQMLVLGVAVTVGLAAATLLRGTPLREAFLIGVAVAVAAVPEGLAATITAALALGGRALAAQGALIRRLNAIETLGETTVICTDKTGTLTENSIRVAAVRAAPGATEDDVVAAALAASPADIVGDPLEEALLAFGADRGIAPTPAGRLRELGFSSERKRATVTYATPAGERACTKGAAELILAIAAEPEPAFAELASAWATEGLRVLAVAERTLPPGTPDARVEEELTLLGLIAFHDPVREASAPAVAAARAAGVAVVMVTGDHPSTARAVAAAVGIDEDSVVARATPADKLALVERLQAAGEIVAVTGDGVNDAPALRRADVGIAMGRGGTEAAREAAAVVLTDDDFATIVAAIREGRRIGDNIRHFVAFLLSANFGEVLLFAVAVGAGLGTPLAVIQVLLVNLVTDGLPAVALARDPASAGTMGSPPRLGDRLFDRATWLRLALVGTVVGACSLAAFELGGDDGQTAAFATLALSELVLVYGMRSETLPPWRLPRNRWLDAAVLGSAALVAAAIFVPPLQGAFATATLGLGTGAAVLGLALVPLAVLEASKRLARGLPAPPLRQRAEFAAAPQAQNRVESKGGSR